MEILGAVLVLALLGAVILSGAALTVLAGAAGVILVVAVACLIVGLAVNIVGFIIKIMLTFLLACLLKWIFRKVIDLADAHTSLLQGTSTEQLEKISMAAGGIVAVWYMFLY